MTLCDTIRQDGQPAVRWQRYCGYVLHVGAKQRCLQQHVTCKWILEFESYIELRFPESVRGSI